LDLPFAGDDLYLLRAAVAAHAGRLGVADDRIGHLVTVASELAANAIRHGGGAGRLRLWRDPTAVFCQVSDHGPGIPDPMIGSQPAGSGAVGRARRVDLPATLRPPDDR